MGIRIKQDQSEVSPQIVVELSDCGQNYQEKEFLFPQEYQLSKLLVISDTMWGESTRMKPTQRGRKWGD
jgi:hypothetical protein